MSETQTPNLETLPSQPPIYEGEDYRVGELPGPIDQGSETDSQATTHEGNDESSRSSEISLSDVKSMYYDGRSVIAGLRASRQERRANNFERKKAAYGDMGALALGKEGVEAILSNGEEPRAKFGEKVRAHLAKRRITKLNDARADVIIAKNYNLKGSYGDKRLRKAERKLNRKVNKIESSVLGHKHQNKLEKKRKKAIKKAEKHNSRSDMYEEKFNSLNSYIEDADRDMGVENQTYTPDNPMEDGNAQSANNELPFKIIDTTTIESTPEEPKLEYAKVVKNDEVEDDWIIESLNPTSKTIKVTKKSPDGKGKFIKHISAEDFLKNNPENESDTYATVRSWPRDKEEAPLVVDDLPEPEETTEEDDRLTALGLSKGETASYVNGIGEVEDNWVVRGIDPVDGRILVRTVSGNGEIRQRRIKPESFVKTTKPRTAKVSAPAEKDPYEALQNIAPNA